jgi:transposase
MTWVGLDVHARSISAAAIDVMSGELRRARFGPGHEELLGWLAERRGPVRVVYEAGPTGFALYRQARAAGIEIAVIAPSKTARPSGDKVKNDRKDAELLVRLAMAGQLTAVKVPDEFTEACRHLTRCREQVRGDLMSARHRVSKLLLAHGRVYAGGTTWNAKHRAWLAAQKFDQPAAELAFIDLLAAVDGLITRRDVLDERLSRLASDPRLWPTVARLRCFRGVDTLTALALHLELGGDWQRFPSPRGLFAWLGLTPSLDESGESRSQGSITKTGSTYARRLLVEAAWHYARAPSTGATLRQRQAGQPENVLRIASRAQHRLHRQYVRLKERGKPHNVVTVAIARELAGFLWAAAVAP